MFCCRLPSPGGANRCCICVWCLVFVRCCCCYGDGEDDDDEEDDDPILLASPKRATKEAPSKRKEPLPLQYDDERFSDFDPEDGDKAKPKVKAKSKKGKAKPSADPDVDGAQPQKKKRKTKEKTSEEAAKLPKAIVDSAPVYKSKEFIDDSDDGECGFQFLAQRSP